ncbi:MAG TPA: hypothetical protein VLS49_06185 [Usitatibacter sp.]|nr:hypothetical protein [Usitatibacter sp.]
MTKNLLVLLAASLLAAACAALQGGAGKGPPCTTHVCQVTVRVDAACRISVDPVDLPVDANNKNAVIQWDLTGGEFAQGGIAFKQAVGDEFHSWSHSPKRITVVDRHTRTGVIYHYGVRVMQGARACPTLDPTIMN